MRSLILAIVLVGCVHRQPQQIAAPQPVAPAKEEPTAAAATPTLNPVTNLVCERFAIINPTAKCTPEDTAAGEHHLHRARVELGGQLIACVINDATPSIICSEAIIVSMQPPPPSEPSKPEPPKKKAKR